ncbi:MAG: UDP-glucose 4-epimerase GalE [Alphaproteobacteria bacterium]|nr:UDP-glucose 4-epimerase GalE [Alphaproteobacteria bacterium]
MKYTNPRTVIVTGGAGYIGSHTAKALARQGDLPVTVDSLIRGHRDNVRWGPLEVGDIGDREFLLEVFARYQPQAIIHFAAFAAVGESVEHPELYYRNNLLGSMTLFEAAIAAGIRVVVFSSTCATYGNPIELPIAETAAQNPVNPYGWSKVMVEQILADYARAYDLRATALRYFNAAGADPEGEVGLRNPTSLLIPLALRAALGKVGALEVFGIDYHTRDGTGIRDYIHVSDLAEAHLLALDELLDEYPHCGRFQAYNLGTGKGHSVLEVLAEVNRALGAFAPTAGLQVPYRLAARRAGDPAVLYADPSLARQQLGWQCRHSDLATIVQTALLWEWRLHNQA